MVSALREALNELFASPFAGLLHLVVPAHVFGQTLGWIRALAENGPKPAPLVVLASPSFGPSRGWPARLRELLAAAPSVDVGMSAFADPLDAFADALGQVAPKQGPRMVVVLAPQHIEDAAEQARDIESLVRRPSLLHVRFVVVDAVHNTLGNLAERLSPRGTRVAWIEADSRDWAAIEREVAPLRARSGQLSPGLEDRIARGSPLRGPGFEDVRRSLELAESATSPVETARLLDDAGRLLDQRGLGREAVEVGLQRGRVLLGAGLADAGVAAVQAAIRLAEERGVDALLPEALGSLGAVEVRRGRFAEGLDAYQRAAEFAEKRGDRALAADFLRCGGHAALNAGRAVDGLRLWRRAFELFDTTAPITMNLAEPQQLLVTAVALADLFEQRGHAGAAEALRGHATAIEQNAPRKPTSWD